MHSADTIAAIATAPGGAARGIVRLSGPTVFDCLERCFAPAPEDRAAAQRPTAGPHVVPGTLRLEGGRLPCDLYLWPGKRSYTREPLAELHTLGSPPLLAAALRTLRQAGARLAQPGEFTLRAFLAGRLDLVQAEAVLGVIEARGQSQLATALAQLAGGLSAPLARLREQLLGLLAHLEAGLDFADERIEFISASELDRQLAAAEKQIAGLVEQMRARTAVRELPRVVLVGWPNVGKSSLFNALAARFSHEHRPAIVSSQAGTTRDYLSTELDLDGHRYELIDTAGIQPDEVAPIPAAAQTIAAGQAQRAQLRLVCLDSSRPLNAWERSEISQAPNGGQGLSTEAEPSWLVVLTKADEPRRIDLPAELDATMVVATSSLTTAGLDQLAEGIARRISAGGDGHGPVTDTAIRCRDGLDSAAAAVSRARHLVAVQRGDERGGAPLDGEELVAIELRTALDELGQVVGAVYTDDILDRIFSRFCIGK